MTVCGKSWKDFEGAYIFCTRPALHEGNCINSVLGGKPPDVKFFEDDLDAQAEIAKEIELDRKREAKKHPK